MFKKFIINKKEIIRLPIPTESMPIAVDKEEIKENLIQYFIDTSIDNGCLKASEINNIIYPLEVNVNSICGYDRPPALHYSEPKTKR